MAGIFLQSGYQKPEHIIFSTQVIFMSFFKSSFSSGKFEFIGCDNIKDCRNENSMAERCRLAPYTFAGVVFWFCLALF